MASVLEHMAAAEEIKCIQPVPVTIKLVMAQHIQHVPGIIQNAKAQKINQISSS